MNTDPCQRYLEDPEAHPAHLDDCEDCRSLFASLDGADALPERDRRGVTMAPLPLAPWEGASHRAWPVVVGGAVLLVVISTLLFLIAGVSPAVGFSHAVSSNVPSVGTAMTTAQLVGEALQRAPGAWQAGIAIAFLVVNGLLIVLLRRAPRGVDV